MALIIGIDIASHPGRATLHDRSVGDPAFHQVDVLHEPAIGYILSNERRSPASGSSVPWRVGVRQLEEPRGRPDWS
jgi:hypothetical protein